MRVLWFLLLPFVANAFPLPVQFCAQPAFRGGNTAMVRAAPIMNDIVIVELSGWCRLMDPYYIPGPSSTTITATLGDQTVTSPPIVVDDEGDQYVEPFSLLLGFRVSDGLGVAALEGAAPVWVQGGAGGSPAALDLSLQTTVASCCNLEVVSVDPSMPLSLLSAPFGR